MADSDEHQVSSSTLFSEGVHHYQPEPDTETETETEPESEPEPRPDLFSVDDIVDLVGGAQDALERHMAAFTQTFTAPLEEALAFPEPGEELPVPDSTTRPPVPEEPKVVAPKVEPERPKVAPEPPAAPPKVKLPKVEQQQPRVEPPKVEPPAPASDALPAAEPRTAAPAPAEAAAQTAATHHPPARVSDAPPLAPPPKAQLHLLMQFPTELGQRGDCPAPISPLSPLHSPDSLEELSLTESPNQPPPAGPAPPADHPPTAASRDRPWEAEEGGIGLGRGKDLVAGPYLSLGKDPGPPCEDSGVSFSPEEKLASSDRSSTRSSSGPSPVNPPPDLASSNPTERWDSPFLASQDASKASMEPPAQDLPPLRSSTGQPDPRGGQSDEDDLMLEVKRSSNPFEGYSPLADSGYPYFGEVKSDGGASKMSDSPTPDLVQYGEPQEGLPSVLGEGKRSEEPPPSQSGVQEDADEEDAALPPSLPDILKSSPRNPDKLDSGSSEGSPEDQSPIFERKMMESPNPPINLSANNPFAFEAKVSLLKEMTEEMEARDSGRARAEEDQGFGTFDLVKEAEEGGPPKGGKEPPVEVEQQDWFSGREASRGAPKFEPLDFLSRRAAAEDSESESPTADSLSPVLEAMAKDPASFQVETEEKSGAKMEVEEPEVAEEVSEHEVSSEEFEFIERPPRGVIDEFLEALDTSKFASSKPPEIPTDDDLGFQPREEPKEEPEAAQPPEAPAQSSYRLLTQASPQKSKAELEEPGVRRSPAAAKEPAVQRNRTGNLFRLPKVDVRAVVDLLYWRDVKTTGVVFGAALLLLLSLSVCSIVSVCSYVGLALLSVTICFRMYKGILQAIQKSDEGHPFRQYLDQEVALSPDLVHKYSDLVLAQVNKTIGEMRRLFLVEDLVDSIKFAVLMWILTYIGALFNGLTLLILGLVGAFSCPIIYEKHQAQIDNALALVNNHIKDIVGKIQAKVPGMKRKTE